MEIKMKQVWYHANCPDGFCAAWIAHKKFGDDADYVPVQYGNPPPKFPEGATIYILDFSYPPDVLAKIADMASRLIVLDHHVSARRDMEQAAAQLASPKIALKFDMEKSGAMMTWEHFYDEVPPTLVSYVMDRDLWRWKLPDSQAISMVVRQTGFDCIEKFSAWDLLAEELQSDSMSVAARGYLLLDFMKVQVDVMCKNARMLKVWDGCKELLSPALNAACGTFDDCGHVVPVVNASCFFSEVGDRLCELYPDAPFSAYYFDRADGKRQWGLRSRKKDFDCSIIAKNFGGGGHPGSAGFTESI